MLREQKLQFHIIPSFCLFKTETVKVVEKKKKKPLAERIKEKEEAKKKKLKELEEVCFFNSQIS